MGRPEKPIDPTRPLAPFAGGLRVLRRDAGLTYRDLARETGYVPSVLSAAAGGEVLPTWEVTLAYLRACGVTDDIAVQQWRQRWEAAGSQAQPDTQPDTQPSTVKLHLIGESRLSVRDQPRTPRDDHDSQSPALDRDGGRHWRSAAGEASAPSSASWDRLSDTERAIARLVSQALTNHQIATRIHLSPHTINYHLRQIYRKLEINSRVQLASLAQAQNLGQADTADSTEPSATGRRQPLMGTSPGPSVGRVDDSIRAGWAASATGRRQPSTGTSPGAWVGRANDSIPGGWAGELAHLFRRLQMTTGADPVTGKPISLRQIAGWSGYVPSHVRNVLSGRGRPSVDAVLAVADALGASAEDRRRAAYYAGQLGRAASEGTRQNQRAGSPRPVPAQLPAMPGIFVGRHRELAQLRAAAEVGAAVTALVGMGGVGKTTLALQYAHQVRDQFPDGQLFVDLRGASPEGPTLPGAVLSGFLSAVGIDPLSVPAQLDEQAALFRSVVADRRMLIVLDNVVSADQVAPLLPGARGCQVIVTSRQQMAGLVVRYDALTVDVGPLPPAQAAEMLRLWMDRSGVQHAADDETIAEVVRLCGALPLALRIVAARLATRPALSLKDIRRDLADAQHRLQVLDADDISISESIEWSWRAVPHSATRLLQRLALAGRSDIDVGAAAAVASTDAVHVQRDLDALVRMNLLAETGPGRYRCHDLIREFALRTVQTEDAPQERMEAIRRLREYDHRVATTPDHAGQGPPASGNPPADPEAEQAGDQASRHPDPHPADGDTLVPAGRDEIDLAGDAPSEAPDVDSAAGSGGFLMAAQAYTRGMSAASHRTAERPLGASGGRRDE
jgi:DNA-binding CsgD family transcriptional regulator/predicted ATPase/transcriptional regulator with XRE-family HTH domain